MEKILVFRNDRLGDYVICSNLLKELKKKYGHLTVVCSELNYNLIKKQKFIDEVILYKKNYSIFKKIKILLKLIFQKFYLVVSWDGKKFSLLASCLIFSKNKLCLTYKKVKKIFGLKINIYRPSLIFSKLFFKKNIFFTSRKNLEKTEHLPSIYYNLIKEFLPEVKKNDDYFLEDDEESNNEFLKIKKKNNLNSYILIQFDEKWVDIKNVDTSIHSLILNLSNKLNYPVVVTSYNNNFLYFKNFKEKMIIENNKKIVILEDLDVNLFNKFIKEAYINISCHSGFVVQSAFCHKTNIVDIINRSEKLWTSCWINNTDKYMQIFKDDGVNKCDIKEIFNKIISLYEKKI